MSLSTSRFGSAHTGTTVKEVLALAKDWAKILGDQDLLKKTIKDAVALGEAEALRADEAKLYIANAESIKSSLVVESDRLLSLKKLLEKQADDHGEKVSVDNSHIQSEKLRLNEIKLSVDSNIKDIKLREQKIVSDNEAILSKKLFLEEWEKKIAEREQSLLNSQREFSKRVEKLKKETEGF